MIGSLTPGLTPLSVAACALALTAVRYPYSDTAPLKVPANDRPGRDSLDFDHKNGKLGALQMFLGDALWETDVTGVTPPRLIAKNIGGLNGFEVGPDGASTRASGADYKSTKNAAKGLAGRVQMARGRGGASYVTQAAGKLTRNDLASGAATEGASGRALPEGVAETPWGGFIAAETAAARLTEIDLARPQCWPHDHLSGSMPLIAAPSASIGKTSTTFSSVSAFLKCSGRSMLARRSDSLNGSRGSVAVLVLIVLMGVS